MNKDYSYDYAWDERYCYPNSNVLKNKLGIMDADQLRTAENMPLRLAYYLSEINVLHPFREGNGRSQHACICLRL